MNKYDIHMAEVSFEDVDETKLRPVLILEDKVCLVSCLSITSNTARAEDYVIQMWKEAGLKKPSAIRLLQALNLDPSLIGRKIGTLHPIDILEIQERLW
ncbi:MAG: type II toxin-antitoxin system PemK/MazF family toxin [Sphaerochaeta sp.]